MIRADCVTQRGCSVSSKCSVLVLIIIIYLTSSSTQVIIVEQQQYTSLPQEQERRIRMRTLSKFVTTTVLTVAITIGSIAKYKPELFFKIPHYGFIPWAISGGAMPPYIVPGPFEEGNTDWLKDGDVVVSVAAKSGTTWMLFCSHQIRVKGNDEEFPYGDVSLSTPWPEFIQTPGDDWEIQKDKYNTTILPDGTPYKNYWDNPGYPFRVFKSHNHAEAFGSLIGDKDKRKKNVRFLAMTRYGLDQIASMVPFFLCHSDGFRNLWGGFPPASSAPIREISKERLEQCKPGGIWFSQFGPYVNSWWKVKDEDNVLFLHYSDAKRDLPGTVSKMAKFYGIGLTEKEHGKIVEKCGFKYMKEHESMFEYTVPLNPDFQGKVMAKGGLIRKGKQGDGKEYFTEVEKEEWHKIEEDHYGDDPVKLNWARYGGDL